MAANRPEVSAPEPGKQPAAPARAPRPIALSAERRQAIESQIAPLSSTARRIAAELPFAADVSDYVRGLEQAGNEIAGRETRANDSKNSESKSTGGRS